MVRDVIPESRLQGSNCLSIAYQICDLGQVTEPLVSCCAHCIAVLSSSCVVVNIKLVNGIQNTYQYICCVKPSDKS